MQSDITALRTEKEILQEKLDRSKKDLEKEKNKPTVVVDKLSERIDAQTNNPKYIKLLQISVFCFLSYIIGTGHLILEMKFNWLVFAVVEFLLVIVYLYVIFKEPAERRSLVSQTVIGAFLVLFGMLAYKFLQ